MVIEEAVCVRTQRTCKFLNTVIISRAHSHILPDRRLQQYLIICSLTTLHLIRSFIECGSPLFHFISDFYLTSFGSTNKQGAVFQIIPSKEVHGEKVFATKFS